MLNAKLTVVGGDAKASEIQLRLPTIIGRGREASLTLPHPLVSRLHTEIVERDGRLFVRDLGSLNGTFVNNKRIETEQVLEPNQLLTLGNVTFRAIYDVPTSSEADRVDAVIEVPVSENIRVCQDVPTKADREAEDAKAPAGPSNFETSRQPTKPPSAQQAPVQADQRSLRVTTGEPERQHSVAFSQSKGLPEAASSAINLAESLDVGGPQPHAVSSIDPADFDFDGEGHKSSVDPDQSDLGSFLKKLPR